MEKIQRKLVLFPRWRLSDICAVYIVAWAVIPYLSRGNIYRYVAILSSIICLLKILYHAKVVVSNYAIASLVLMGILFLHTGVILGSYDSAISRCINLFIYCMLGLISTYYFNYERDKFWTIAIIVLILYVVTSIPSIIALQSNRWVLRNASGRTIRVGIERYAGSYGYSFGCLFLVIFLIYDIRINNKKKFELLAEISLVALFGYIVFNAGYTTALVLLVIGIFAALFFPKRNNIAAIFIMLICAVILIKVVPIGLRWVVSNIEISDVYRAKIAYLTELTNSYGEVTYTDSTRGGMFYESLDALFHNPILGSVWISGQELATGHAVLLDTLVNHGILYFVVYIYVIILTPWRLMRKDKTIQMIYLAMIILLGLTDTIDYATLAIPLFIGPMITVREKEYKTRREI